MTTVPPVPFKPKAPNRRNGGNVFYLRLILGISTVIASCLQFSDLFVLRMGTPYQKDHWTVSFLDHPAHRPYDLSEIKNISLMHVGKTGGSTLRNFVLRASCNVMKFEPNKISCENKFSKKKESQLSKHVVGLSHYDENYPSDELVDKFEAYLFTIRDPVARYISLFHFHSPKSCIIEKRNTVKSGCKAKDQIEKDPSGVHAKYHSYCFPTLQQIFKGLGGPRRFKPSNSTMVKSKECLNLLKTGFRHTGPHKVFGHLTANYRYYAELSKMSQHDKPVFVLRTEALWDDISDLDKRLGGSGDFGDNNRKVTHGSDRVGGKRPKKLIEESRLCCALWPDIVAYREIVERAWNLSPQEKEETYDITLKRCGASSWDDLESHCRQTLWNYDLWKALDPSTVVHR